MKTDYELAKTHSNTCPSTCISYFMFTLEKTSNDVKFHVIFVNYLTNNQGGAGAGPK